MLADPGKVEQILANLVVNARDAMPRGGHLTIETRRVHLSEDYARAHLGARPGPHLVIAVSDTGVGMPAEVQERIFEPFFTTKPPGLGTGLGLSMVFGIVKQAGGSVWVTSEPHRGTTFKVYLPAAAGSAVPAAAAPTPGPQRGHEVVLLVEDDARVRSAAHAILRGLGDRVLVAGGATEALDLVVQHEGPLHLLLTDVVMPGMSGRLLAQEVARLRPDTRVVFMSGYTDDAIVRHGVSTAEIAFLEKPFSPESMARRVREVLDGA